MERALRYEFKQVFPNIEMYPTNAPKDAKAPFFIYFRNSTSWDKTLDGFTKHEEINYIINIFGQTYENMLGIRERVEQILRDMLHSHVGKNEDILIKDLELNDVGEIYEFSLGLYRGIIDFTIYI